MPTYATAAQLRTYVDLDAAALPDNEATRALERAEKDVDGLWGALPYGVTRRWVPADMEAGQAAALRDATCAQAEYRITMGEEYFLVRTPRRTSGPDFSTEGGGGRIGPKCIDELRLGGLWSPTGRATLGGPAPGSTFFTNGPV